MKIKHIILVGFKHVGKSAVGKALARESDLPFLDVDALIEITQEEKIGKKETCAEIVMNHGEVHFRDLEHTALKKALENDKMSVITGGGGVAMKESNQKLMSGHIVINLTAPKGGIFERIMMNGRPSFFPADVEPFDFFQELWDARDPVYRELAVCTIENTGSVRDAVLEIKARLEDI